VWSKLAVALAGIAVAGGAFAVGRESADRDGARAEGRQAGLREGRAVGLLQGRALGRAVGLRDGAAAGVREGRILEAGRSAPRGSRNAARRAFAAGYTAGANDVFGGFDGGWSLSTPYVITLRRGSGAITYRIDTRRPAR
jgi:hypothetical protein